MSWGMFSPFIKTENQRDNLKRKEMDDGSSNKLIEVNQCNVIQTLIIYLLLGH